MFKKINDFLAGWPMTIVGGLFLLASFILPRAGYPAGEKLAWVCVVICGIPLLYLSIWRVIHNRGIAKISSALDAAMFAHALAMRGKAYGSNTGILQDDTGETISRVGHIGRVGMQPTDQEIVKIMIE